MASQTSRGPAACRHWAGARQPLLVLGQDTWPQLLLRVEPRSWGGVDVGLRVMRR